MRLRIIYKILMAAVFTTWWGTAGGQNVENNASQIVVLHDAGGKINKEVSRGSSNMMKVGILGGMMTAEFLAVKRWEERYNSYMKTTEGLADALKAATSLYAEGVITFRCLSEIRNAMSNNPQGIVATMSMNNIYMEVVAEMIKTYQVLDKTLALGGKMNMLTGAERTEILWCLNESMHNMNSKFRKLALSIAYYNMHDVWNQATAGMLECDHKTKAEKALERWKRVPKALKNLED